MLGASLWFIDRYISLHGRIFRQWVVLVRYRLSYEGACGEFVRCSIVTLLVANHVFGQQVNALSSWIFYGRGCRVAWPSRLLQEC